MQRCSLWDTIYDPNRLVEVEGILDLQRLRKYTLHEVSKVTQEGNVTATCVICVCPSIRAVREPSIG